MVLGTALLIFHASTQRIGVFQKNILREHSVREMNSDAHLVKLLAEEVGAWRQK